EWGISDPVPTNLAAIPALTSRGIEVCEGRPIGLVKVWHWCGNDPIRNHVARVDVGRVLEFVGGRLAPGTDEPLDFSHGDEQFNRFGWSIDGWWAFERWRGADPGRIYDQN